MGWDYTNKPMGQSLINFFKDEFPSYNIIDGVIVNNVFYMAVNRKDNDKIIFALIALIDHNDSKFNIGYKAMPEYQNPYYYDAPLSILNKLTPTNDNYARIWRDTCIINYRKQSGGVK